MKKIVGSTLEFSTKFKDMGKNSVFATHIQHIENIKSFTEVLPRPSPWSN